jgi:hypothetical protein
VLVSGSFVGAALLQGVLGVVLIALGTWGLDAAAALAARRTDEESRAQAKASYRRGSLACMAIGGVLLVFGLVALLSGGPG